MAPLLAVMILSLITLARADYFTNPPSFTTGRDGSNTQTQDLSSSFSFGQKVQITWFSPALDGLYISLIIGYWDKKSDVVLTAFLTNQVNNGYYTWTVGDGDGITPEVVAKNPNFSFHLTDVAGNHTSTGNPPGFISHTLSSRGFVIKPNTTSTVASTIAPSPTTSLMSPTGTCSASMPIKKVIPIGISIFVGGCLIGALGLFLGLRSQTTAKKVKTPDDFDNYPTTLSVPQLDLKSFRQTAFHELSGAHRVYELGTGTPTRPTIPQ